MKLRTKFAVVLLFITLVLGGTVYGGLELYKERLVEQEQADVNETAELTASQLDREIADRKDFVGFVASRPEASRFGESDRFLAAFVGNSRFFAAQLVDANGTIVDFHGDVTQDARQESIGSNVSDRPYVETALGGEVYVSDPEYVEATDRYIVVFSAPVFDDRQLEGALAAAIYLDEQTFFGVLSPISRADQRVTVTAGSDVLYGGGDGFDQAVEASRTVESTGWTVTVVRDRSELLYRLRELAIAQGIGLTLVVLSVVAFGAWEYRTTLGQTERLLAGFAALEEGSYDHELSLAAAEEWEQIAAGFNALADSLAAREAQLRQREQRLQVLNRVLRHNLRNSAAIVLGYAGEVRRHSDDPAVLRAVESIEEAGGDLEALSEKARQLEFTMADRGSQPVDVVGAVEDVLADLDESFPDVRFDAELPASAWALAEPSLRMAIANLCENACEHNESERPRLEVAVEVGDDAVTIEVSDNGTGIPDHELSVIRAGKETPLEHGSGLGLWVAQWAIEQSGGSLDFEVDESVGSTAHIELQPADPPEPAAGPERDGPGR